MIDEFLDNSKLVSINYKGKKYQIKKILDLHSITKRILNL